MLSLSRCATPGKLDHLTAVGIESATFATPMLYQLSYEVRLDLVAQ
jgi:hypothetical protein